MLTEAGLRLKRGFPRCLLGTSTSDKPTAAKYREWIFASFLRLGEDDVFGLSPVEVAQYLLKNVKIPCLCYYAIKHSRGNNVARVFSTQ